MVHLIDQGISPRSVNRKIATLRTYFKHLIRNGHLKDNPMQKVQGLKAGKRLPVFVDPDSMKKLFAQWEPSADFNEVRDRLIMELLYATGARVSELVELKQSDVHLSEHHLKVSGKGKKERLVPITDRLESIIQNYLNIKTDTHSISNSLVNNTHLLVKSNGEKLSRMFVYRRVNTYLSKVTTLTKKSPHVLRHTFATHMLNNGADLNSIKELLGHTNLAATQIYTHNTIEQLKNIHEQAHPKG